jgi:hypothetical protein
MFGTIFDAEIVVLQPDTVFAPRGFGSLDGIIAHLTRKCGRNVSDAGVVRITSKSVYDEKSAVRNIADFGTESSFWSGLEPEQWICWNFRSSRVQMTHYTIRTNSSRVNGPHPRSWVIAGSKDGQSWVLLDQQVNNMETNAPGIANTFPVVIQPAFKHIRMTLSDHNHFGNDRLTLSAFEIFGGLIN